MGPNGSSKSTLFKGIVGVVPVTSGKVLVCGNDQPEAPEDITDDGVATGADDRCQKMKPPYGDDRPGPPMQAAVSPKTDPEPA